MGDFVSWGLNLVINIYFLVGFLFIHYICFHIFVLSVSVGRYSLSLYICLSNLFLPVHRPYLVTVSMYLALSI